MMGKEQVYEIKKKDLEIHLKKVDDHLESINRGNLSERDNLLSLMQGIASTNEKLMAPKVQATYETIREGFSLFYQMHALLEDKVNEMKEINNQDKIVFLNSYATFASSSYINSQLNLLDDEKEPLPVDGLQPIRFDITKDDEINMMAARYYGVINSGKRNNNFEEDTDIPRISYTVFKKFQDDSLASKDKLNPKLVDLIKDANFKIADKFTLSGFETNFEDKSKPKFEFVKVYPNQIAGNVEAKKEIRRDMDRMALYDRLIGRNPILESGGLSWSVLLDGLPGTGKSSLFKMAMTLLKERYDQVNEYWKTKNIPSIEPNYIFIDPSIKDEYYGKTGRILLERLAPANSKDGLHLVIIDDIDLLVGDRDSKEGGANKDILNILMQYVDGAKTVIKGNAQLYAATNDPAGLEGALRQRFMARYLVDGPVTWYDFADITYDKLKKLISKGIVPLEMGENYTPYKMREGQTGNEIVEGSEVYEILETYKDKKITLRDIGELAARLKKDNERFTGRAVHAVTQAIVKRVNDYEAPEEWFTDPKRFLEKPYEEKTGILTELCVKVNGPIVAQEFVKYAESEKRYANERFERDVQRMMYNDKVGREFAERTLKSRLKEKQDD